jgi:hypothetical protein
MINVSLLRIFLNTGLTGFPTIPTKEVGTRSTKPVKRQKDRTVKTIDMPSIQRVEHRTNDKLESDIESMIHIN